jgi:hypothetical protein
MMVPFGTAVFCDDIRFELFNKVSLIGVYGYELMLLGSFPTSLPKLGIFTAVRFHKTRSISGVRMLVYFPGDSEAAPSHSQDIPIQLSPDQYPSADPAEYPDPSEYYGFNHPFLFSPVVVRQAGYIRVRAIAGDTVVKVGSLKLREATPEEIANASSGSPPST